MHDEAISATTAVAAANRLTARWARARDGGGTVLSGLGVWPLLAAIADPADGAAREELARAIGFPARQGPDAARTLLEAVERNPAVHTALGLWTAASLPVNDAWVARLPGVSHGVLDAAPTRAQAALDAWVEKETGGMLHRMPVQIDAATLLLLASALTVRTEWAQRFQSMPGAGSGPWSSRRLTALHRQTAVQDVRVAVSDDDGGSVTLATVRGRDEVDVVLALGGPDAPAGSVLGTAVGAVGPEAEIQTEAANLDDPRPGPGLSVTQIQAYDPAPTARLQTVAFNVAARHDLLAQADLFGLHAAADASSGHFPGISSEVPLCVQAAAQDATASFSAEGFVAAAVTAVSMVAAAAMPRIPPHTAKQLTATFDRPFGFVAVDRPTGLVLVCGWVDEPEDYPR